MLINITQSNDSAIFLKSAHTEVVSILLLHENCHNFHFLDLCSYRGQVRYSQWLGWIISRQDFENENTKTHKYVCTILVLRNNMTQMNQLFQIIHNYIQSCGITRHIYCLSVLLELAICERPMGHIAHLRKQFKSINIYGYIITLIKRRKKPLLSLWELNGSSFEQTWIPFTQWCFVPSLVEIGPLVL